MKLSAIENQNIVAAPSAVDLDVVSRVGPAIQSHIKGLETLCNLIPNNGELIQRLNDFKALLGGSVPMQSNMLESKSSNVVYKYDPAKPLEDSEVLILGGAGRYSMSGLKSKIAREAKWIQDSRQIASPEGLLAAARQLSNSVNTLIVATDQISEKMKEHNDNDAREQNAVAEKLSIQSIAEMYDELKPNHSEGTIWVAIAKNLKSQGINSIQIAEAIDKAIVSGIK